MEARSSAHTIIEWMQEKHFWVLMLTAKMNYHLNCIKSFVQPVPAACTMCTCLDP